MTGIQPHSQLAGYLRRLNKRSNGQLRDSEGTVSVWFCIKFHPVGSRFGGIFYHFRVRTYKDRGTYTCLAERIHQFGKERKIGLGIPSGIRRNLIGRIGHQRYLMRFHFQHQVNELLEGYPSILNSVRKQRTKCNTSATRICRSSGRG